MHRLAFLLVVLLAGTVTACDDNNTPTGTDDGVDPAVVTAAAITRNAALMTTLTGSIVAASAAGVVTSAPAGKTAGVDCPAVNVGTDRQNQTVTVTIDAGGSCSWNGRIVRGSVSITVQQGSQASDPVSATAAFNAFSIDSRRISGTVTTTFTYDAGIATGTATADLRVEDEFSTSSLDGEMNVVAETNQTADLSDNAVQIWGTGSIAQSGVTAGSADLSIAEDTALSYSDNCPVPRNGLLQAELSTDGQAIPAVTVDFGPVAGGCDTVVTITVAGRTSEEVDFAVLAQEGL